MAQKDERGFIFLQAGRKIYFRHVARCPEDVEIFVQVELEDKSKRDRPWIIFRCDRRKDVSYHIDVYDINEEKVISHRKLKSQNPYDALEEVFCILKNNLMEYMKKYGFQNFVNELPDNWKDLLNDAKKYLFEVLEKPEDIKGKMNRTALGISVDAILADSVTIKLEKRKSSN